MADTDPLPTEFPSEQRDEVETEPPPRPPRRSRRRVVVAVLAGAVAVALGAFGVSRLAGTPTPASATNGSASSTITRSAPAAHPLTTAAIAKRVDPGLVDINVSFGLQGAAGAATGMVLTPSGEVLTNNHVIQGATRVTVTDIGNGKTYTAKVVGYARTRDVAVLQLQGAHGLQTVPLGDSATVALGARVTALGNAGGAGGTPRVAAGAVTALDQTITASDANGANAERLRGLIETNAGIRPGDSGGPLVNVYGQVIGMDAAASSGPATSATQGFAIPIDQALAIAQSIETGAGSSVVHVGPTGFLGVQVVGFAQAGGTPGAVIGGVIAGSPAQHVGLSQGDVITAVDGQAIQSPSDLTDLLATHHPGDRVRLQWVDPAGQTHTGTATLASGPPQ